MKFFIGFIVQYICSCHLDSTLCYNKPLRGFKGKFIRITRALSEKTKPDVLIAVSIIYMGG